MNNEQLVPVQVKEETAFDIKQWLFRVLGIWPWIILSLSICLTIAFFHLRSTEPIFLSRALVLIKDPARGGYGSADEAILNQLGLNSYGTMIENEIEVLKTFDLMVEAVKRSQLYVTVKHKGRISEHTLYGSELPFTWEFANPVDIKKIYVWTLTRNNEQWMVSTKDGAKPVALQTGKWYNIDNVKCRIWPNINFETYVPIWDEYSITISPVETAAAEFQTALSVGAVNDKAAVISLQLYDKNIVRANDALNSLLAVYSQLGLNDKNQATANTMDFLTERLGSVEKELKGVEGQVERFKTANKLTDISADAQQFLSMVSEVDRLKAEQETKVSVINELEKELVMNQDNPRMVPSSLGIDEPSLLELISKHNELLLEKDRLKAKVGNANPGLVDLENQIRDIRRSLVANVKSLRNSFELTLSSINKKDNMLNARLATMPSLEKDFVQITRDKSVKEQLYLFLLQKREEAAVTLASAIPDSRNIEKARSQGQIAPKKNNIWALAWSIGLLIPILIIVVLEFFNNKVGIRKEVEQKTIAPVLGEITFLKNLDNPIPVLKGGRSVIAEQFRTIRTAISFTKHGISSKKILITSHRPGEGKSFTSLNLAASYALLHKSVVILEFDLRKPRLSKNLGIQVENGISSYLTRDVNLNDILIKVPGHEAENFYLLPSGPIPPNPAELILSANMTKLIDDLEKRFDYIIIDTPPFSVVTDATLLQRYADLTIVVLRQGYTFKTVYEDLNQRAYNYPDLPLYTVINGVGRSQRYGAYTYGYGYGYGNGYSYGYGDGYYEDPNKKSKKFWSKLKL